MTRIHSRIAALVATIALVAAGIFAGSLSGEAATPRKLVAPFASGTTWYVCQGYSTGTHSTGPALDLVASSKDLVTDPVSGKKVCKDGAKSSVGKTVYAPAEGTVSWNDRPFGALCLDLKSGGSMQFAHLVDGTYPAPGKVVKVAKPLGVIAPPAADGEWPNNNGVAHLHVSAFPAPGCAKGTSVPFSDQSKFRLTCAPNMTLDGSPRQWNGAKVTRCVSGNLGGVNMQTACDKQYPGKSYKAKVTNSTSAYSWKCVKGSTMKSIDVTKECKRRYTSLASGRVADAHNPYSWYCYRP